MATAPEPLPLDAVLLHIGPHKTGTSAMQSALGSVRGELAKRGVTYLGEPRHREQAPLAALHKRGRVGIRRPEDGDWDRLVAEVEGTRGHRAVLSSERYCWANQDQARQVVDDLGRGRVHVVITLRPLDRILPSQWQMSVQGGLTSTYDEWLHDVFDVGRRRTREAGRFWRRHAHGSLVARWVAAVGAAKVSVVVVDQRDRSMLPEAFAALLDLPEGLLVPRAAKSNRSLTSSEVELVRQVNESFEDHGWSAAEHAELVRRGLSRSLVRREPEPGEPPITTPPWALERAAARADTSVSEIRASGARVIGDLESLRIDVRRPHLRSVDASQLPVSAATLAVMGALEKVTHRPTAEQPVAAPIGARLVPDRLKPMARRARRRARVLRNRVRRQPGREGD